MWSVFLFGINLEGEIYMQQPHGYEVKEKKELVFMLKKILYGLKAPRYSVFEDWQVSSSKGYSQWYFDHYNYFQILDIGRYMILLF